LLELNQYLRNIGFSDVVYVRAAGILDLFRVTAETTLVISIDPNQGEESTSL
jgi:hypothetical protein